MLRLRAQTVSLLPGLRLCHCHRRLRLCLRLRLRHCHRCLRHCHRCLRHHHIAIVVYLIIIIATVIIIVIFIIIFPRKAGGPVKLPAITSIATSLGALQVHFCLPKMMMMMIYTWAYTQIRFKYVCVFVAEILKYMPRPKSVGIFTIG